MTNNKDNIIDFPVVKTKQPIKKKVNKDCLEEVINHLLQDKEGRQTFIKERTQNETRYLLSDGIENQSIKRKNNITLPLCVDTEFTDFLGNLKNITLDYLEQNKNKFKTQYDFQKNYLNNLQKQCVTEARKINLEDVASGKIKEIPFELLEKYQNCKLQSNQLLSTQIKHCLYDDHTLLFNPAIEHIVNKHVGNKELFYKKDSQLHIIDYLKNKGFDVEIKRHSPDLPRKEFNKKFGIDEKNEKLPICTITIYAFFLLAELCKIFGGELANDILSAIRKNKIQMNRRISTGIAKKLFPNWLIVINGITYKLAIDFADTGALQGNISLSDNLKNLNMGTDAKNLMDDYKSNMLLGLIKHPKEWKEYALNDLVVYDVYKEFSKKFEEVYQSLEISKFFTPPKMTIGSTVNNLTEAILLNHLKYEERKKENLKELYDLTIYATPKKLGCYTTITGVEKNKNEIRQKHTGAKTAGGRCFLNRQVLLATTEYTLCDIDISSAYTTIASSLSYYFGNPVIQSFTKHKVTLREFLKHYKKKLQKRSYKLIVETKNPLKIEQDLLVSFPNLRSQKKNFYDDNGNILKSDIFLNTDNIETSIYTTMLYSTPLSWDDINIILKSWKPEQIKEFLDNVTMVSAVYYPERFECKTIGELKEKQAIHAEKDNGRFKDVMAHSWIDNSDGELSHYWYSTNFGKLCMDEIIQLRRRNKKTNYSLSYLFKLIGNTVYGNSVSKHFDISNIVFASNITAMCRGAMWCVEKSLDIHQTITDGGIFNLNEAIHKLRNNLDTTSIVRAYCQNKRDLRMSKKWQYKPITKNGKKIEYIKGKGWVCDDVIYSFNYDEVKPLEDKYNKLKSELGEKHEKTKEVKVIFDNSMGGLNKFLKVINQLALDHVKKEFSEIDLFNGEFEKLKVNDEGIAIKDFKDDYIYKKVKGLIEFEVKNICDWSVFHGSADYMYNNPTNNLTTKMRGYESKRGLLAVIMEHNEFIYDEKYYNDISPTQRFLNDIKDNHNSVSIPLPYFKQAILKPKEYKKNYKRLWEKTVIFPGNTIYKFMTIPIYSMRHKFKDYEQHKSWIKQQNMLKRRGGGLGFEQFYLNDDGTIRYKDMLEDIDKHIRNGVVNPASVFDKDNNFFRDIKYKKNEKKYKIILEHIKLTTTMKNLCRIMTIGLYEYCLENMKSKKDGMFILRKTLKNSPSDYADDYENLNQYSNCNEFEHKELAVCF
jgi:hypothetical protein